MAGNASFAEQARVFEALSSALPVLLIPVRLETRFDTRPSPTRLRIRIFPDQLSIDDHDERLSRSEHRLARQFWTRFDQEKQDPEARDAVWQWLVSKLGAWRASWVARVSRAGQAKRTLREDNEQRVARAPLLPDRWYVVGYVAGNRVLEALSRPVAADLAFSPDLEHVAEQSDDLSVDPALRWLFDFDLAVAKGMAIEVELNEHAKDGLDELFVVGIKTGGPSKGETKLTPAKAAEQLEQLLASQHYVRGGGFVPQGTPTNNTEETQAGWSAFDPDLEATLRRELGEDSSAPAALASTRDHSRGSLAPAEALPRGLAEDSKNYRVLEKALGLKPGSVLKRFEYREGFEKAAMEAMNTLLWAVSLGEYLGTLLAKKSGSMLSPMQLNWIRDWFRNHVKGGAALPALRFADAPYGILPTQSLSRLRLKDANEAALFGTLEWLMEKWLHEAYEGDRLLQLGERRKGRTSPGAVLLELLSKQPNPVEFSASHLKYQEGWITAGYELAKQSVTNTDLSEGARELDEAYHELGLRELGTTAFASIHDQRAAYNELRMTLEEKQADLKGLRDRGQIKDLEEAWLSHVEAMLGRVDTLLSLLDDHQVRVLGLELAGLVPDHCKGVLESDHDDPNIAFCRYGDTWHRWPAKRLVIVPDGDATVFPARYLTHLRVVAQAILNPSTEVGPSPFEDKPQPLLYQLIRTSIGRTSTKKRARELIRSIDTLKTLSWDQLELLLQQSLGLAGGRFDAWYTSFAVKRLAALREKKPGGIQLGAFGWVEDLRPRPPSAAGADALSQGFIHTPSLNHARTAAVLRSGWNTYGTDRASSALAVDLSSDRVRTASWLFDAVRQGQDLGDALGYRFERLLHDHRLDHWVHPVRKAVLERTREKEDPRNPVVDGMELLNVWRSGKGKAALEKLTNKHFPSNPPGVGEIESLLQRLDQASDAMADAAVADSVHALTQGNPLRAGSSLAAISRGDVPPPELQVVNTTRSGMTLTHRVMLLAPGALTEHPWLGDASGALVSPRATVDPDTEHLVAAILGNPDRIGFEVGYRDRDGNIRHRSELSVAELLNRSSDYSIGALDLLAMTPDRPGSSALELWISAYLDASRPPGVGAGWFPVVIWDGDIGEPNRSASTLLWLQGWRGVIHQARAVAPRDLVHEQPEDGVEAQLAVEQLERRASSLLGSLSALLTDVDRLLPEQTAESPRPVGSASESELRDKLLALSRYDLPQAIPRIDPGFDRRHAHYEQLWSSYAAARKKLNAAKALTIDPGAEPAERARRARALVQAVLGRNMAVSVPVRPASFERIFASLERGEERLNGDTVACHEWLERIGYVRPALKQLSEAVLIHDAQSRDGGGLSFTVGQWPDLPGEEWVALHQPADGGRSRLSILLGLADGVELDRSIAKDGYLAGLLIDEMVERVPKDREDTGVAMHFDAPNTESPQAMLLAVAPEGERWDFELMVDTLRDTLEWARLRTLDGDDIRDFDHHLPAVFAGSGLVSSLER